MPEKKPASTPASGDVVLDFSGVRPFEPPDTSITYLCRITEAKNGKSKPERGSKPKTSVQFTIEAPEEAPVEEWIEDSAAEGGWRKGEGNLDRVTKTKGRILFREYSWDEDAKPFLYEFIKAATPDAVLDEKYHFNPKNFMGRQVACRIRNRAYNDQVRPEPKRILPASAYKG